MHINRICLQRVPIKTEDIAPLILVFAIFRQVGLLYLNLCKICRFATFKRCDCIAREKVHICILVRGSGMGWIQAAHFIMAAYFTFLIYMGLHDW